MAAKISVTSPAFQEGQPIPKKFSGEGEDVSPALSWSGIPEGTKEIVLICDDPDAPTPQPWVHWVIYGIPGSSTGLKENVARKETLEDGSKQGLSSFKRIGYGGPMPPPGRGMHHYHFKLYAVKQATGLKPGATKQEVLKAIQGQTLAEGALIGTYKR